MICAGSEAQQGTEENNTQRCDGKVATIDALTLPDLYPWHLSD